MQLLIVALLVLIVLILAPGLIWLLVAGAAAYAVWLALAAALGVAVFVVVIISTQFRRKAAKSNINQRIDEANRLFRANEAAKAAKAAISKPVIAEAPKPAVVRRIKPCPHCQVEIAKGSLYCPSCGKGVPA